MEKGKRKRKLYEEDNGFAQFGGYMAAKKSKLSRQFNNSKVGTAASNIFNGVSIHVNGYTTPSADELKKLMMEHGGAYHHYYSRTKTSHIIASILPHTKIKNLKDEKVVKPEWITDSIAAGKLLSCSKYLLYNPGVLQGQTKLGFSADELKDFTCSASLDAGCASSGSDIKARITSECSVTAITDAASSSVNKLGSENSNSCTLILSNSSSTNDLCSEFGQEKMPADSDEFGEAESCLLDVDSKNECFSTSSLEHETITDLTPTEESTPPTAMPETVKELSLCGMHEAAGVSETSRVPSNDGDSSKRLAVKAGDANFLSEFYSHSRLHHIATAGSEFKDYVRKLQTDHQGVFPGRELLRKEILHMNISDSLCIQPNHKVIMHIDMDCFFVSVGLLKRPDLIGKPVAVTHSRGNPVPHRQGVDAQFEQNYYQQKRDSRKGSKANEQQVVASETKIPLDFASKESLGSTSEISSCSYEARKFGVSSGMFLGEALKRCPDLQTIPYDFEGYTRVSKLLYETLTSYTLQVEAISCDEMFVDCTDILLSCGTSPLIFSQHLRSQIFSKTGCTASAGLGSNLLIARLATRLAKPNGQWYVPPEENQSFMLSQPVKNLPGVGFSLGGQLKSLGIDNCSQLQAMTLEKLQKEFGAKTGKTLYDQCRGIDHRVVVTEKERKSVSAEINYGMRFQKIEEAEKFLKEIAGEVEKRLQKADKIGNHVTLKLKIRSKAAPVETAKYLGHGVCDNVARSFQLPFPVDSAEVIGRECCAALKSMKVAASDIRGMGIQVSRLSSAKSKQQIRKIEDFLFNQPSTSHSKTVKSFQTVPEVFPDGSASVIPTVAKKTLNREWFPSPSQIDPEVWIALPKDIQSQLASEYKSMGSDVTVGVKEAPVKTTRVTEALPHFSQLDASVMDALPDDIRHELLEAYSNRGKQATVSPVKSKVKKVVKSPVSKRSYKRKNQTSPNKRVQATVNKDKISSPLKVPKSPVKVPQEEVFKASLCGATELTDVRPLMKEWILSTQNPIEDDVRLFINYIQDVIHERDLEKLDLILKCFFWNISKSKNKEWEHIYEQVVHDMQPRVKDLYGFPLKVPCFTCS